MKKRRLKKRSKRIFILIILIFIIITLFLFLKKDIVKEIPSLKKDYVELVSNLTGEDKEFLTWVNDNYKDSLKELYDYLNDFEYDFKLWHKFTSNSYIVLKDLYNDLYKTMDNVKIIDINNKDEVILSFAGDVSLADNWQIMPLYDSKNKGVLGILSSEVVDEMNNSDLMVVNSEFTVSKRGTPLSGKAFTFRADPKRLSIYAEMGVDLVTLANNHVYDFGQDAFLDMLDSFDEINMPRVGAGRDIDEASRPYYFIINGYKYAFLNSTRAEKIILTPGATKTSPGVFRSYDPTMMEEKIKEVRNDTDFIITIVHFGAEGSHSLEEEQISSAKKFIDAGADAIIGHHAHVLQGFEFYKDKLIAYNLGNFIFNNHNLDTMLYQIKVDNDGNFSYNVIPGLQKDGYTKFVSGKEKENVINNLNKWSINVIIDNDGKIGKR